MAWSKAAEAASKEAKEFANEMTVAASMATRRPNDPEGYATMLEGDLPSNLDNFAKGRVKAERDRIFRGFTNFRGCHCMTGKCKDCVAFVEEVIEWLKEQSDGSSNG